MSYNRYIEIAEFLGINSAITQQAYHDIESSRPNAFTNVPTIAVWNASEIEEFEHEVEPMAEKLGYEYRVNRLSPPEIIEPSVNLSNLNIESKVDIMKRYISKIMKF